MKPDIIYFKTSDSSFILTDQRLLEKHYSVKSYYINNTNGIKYAFSLVKLVFFLLFVGRKAKIYFIRFADWHGAIIAFFKKIYRKRFIIVVGGFDAFHLPEYAYGVYHRKFRGRCAKYALKNASLIMPNSPCLIEYTNTYASEKPIQGGIKHFVPDLKTDIKVVYNGFDIEYWKNTAVTEKKDIVTTVAKVNNMRNFRLKGVDSFIELAAQMPDYKFRIAGVSKDFLARHPSIHIPPNLEVVGFIPHQQLLKYYLESKVFCLFSLTEGMSNVLCEAMLCECIPVGSNVTFIPEIIDDCGYIVNHRDIKEMKEKVETALKVSPSLGKLAKQRIIDNYSLKTREDALVDLIDTQLKIINKQNLL
jgi:glycosyltransferase involved in cell wall biosynthesis